MEEIVRLNKNSFKEVAMDLANESDEIQALFFNTFFKALRVNCLDEFRTQMQLCNIDDNLTLESKERIKFLGAGNE